MIVPNEPISGITSNSCPDLTDRQRDILGFLLDFRRRNQRMPTGSEIARNFAFSSVNSAYRHIGRLVDKGYLYPNTAQSGYLNTWIPTPKALRLSGQAFTLLGQVPGGSRADSSEGGATLVSTLRDLLPEFQEDDLIFPVSDDAMIGDDISPGCYVVVRPTISPRSGQLCACRVQTMRHVLVRRLQVEGERTVLHSSNEEYGDVILKSSECDIIGYVVARIRVLEFLS